MASASTQIHAFTTTTFATPRTTPKFSSSNSLFFGSTRTANAARLTGAALKASTRGLHHHGPVRVAAEKVEKLVEDAERFAKEDKEKRDSMYTKNQAFSVVYQTEKQLKEVGEKIPAPVKEKLGELKDAISGGVTQAIKDATTALNEEVMQMGQSLYTQPGAAQSSAAPGAEAGGARPKGIKKTRKSSQSSAPDAEVKVSAQFMRMSVFKARRVIDQIRGRSYEDTLMILELMPYRASYPILKVVYSAAASGSHNLGLNEADAYIRRAEVNGGPFVKKLRPRARGRCFAEKRPSCHLTIVLGWRKT